MGGKLLGETARVLAAAFALAAAAAASQTAGDLTVTTRARAIRPGEVVVLTIDTRTKASSVRVRAFERDIEPFAVNARTWRALVGIDLSTEPGSHDVVVEAAPGDRRRVVPIHVSARKFPTRTLKVDPAFVTPPPEARDRIERESAELEGLWAAPPTAREWAGRFVRPVPHAANSAFGTHSVFNGEPRSQHSGADFRSPAGTPVRAPNAGRVAIAGDRYFPGGTVVIDHGLGLLSLFAHLSSIEVRPGDRVTRGTVIGRVGATGRVTGPHLHWAVRLHGARVDPLSLLWAASR